MSRSLSILIVTLGLMLATVCFAGAGTPVVTRQKCEAAKIARRRANARHASPESGRGIMPGRRPTR